MSKQEASKGQRQSSIKTPSGGDSKGSTCDESATQKRTSSPESDEPGPSTSGGRQSPTKRPAGGFQFELSKKRRRKETEESVSLGDPEELGGYSLDQSENVYPDDKRKLRYYVENEPSKCGFNLCEGYQSFNKLQPCKGLNILLEWVMNHKDQRGNNIDSLRENDFVCTRGLLTKVFSWSSDTKEKECLAILVTKFKGIYFLRPAEKGGKGKQGAKTPRRQPYQQAQKQPDPEEKKYWGWKFEQYVTAETQNGVPDTTKQVDEKESYSIVVRRRLKEHSLVFAGEVDAFDARDGKYVELKTHGGRPKDDEFLRDTYILIKWWAQSYLLGIERIVCGFRNDMKGTVHTVKEFKTIDVLTMIEDGTDWRPQQGFQLLEACLQTVKNRRIEDDPNKVYLLTVGRDLTPSLVESPDHKTEGILTPEFIAWMQPEG